MSSVKQTVEQAALVQPAHSMGLLIVIDGTDGSGKATQTKLLVDRLTDHGCTVQTMAFPQYGKKSAGLVEEYLSGAYGTADAVDPRIAAFFFAADRYDASFQIRQWLDSGCVVVLDRYVSANMGHQGAKIADVDKRQRFMTWIYRLEHEFFDIPVPDMNLILHVPAAVSQQLAQQRNEKEWAGKTRDIHEDDAQHLAAAEATYLWMAQQYPEFHLLSCTADNQMLPRNVIAERIWQVVKEKL